MARAGAFLGGLVLGTAIGTAIGLLVAPRRGKETRQLVRRSLGGIPEVADDVTQSLQQRTERLLDAAQRSADEAWARLQEAIATGKKAMDEQRRQLQLQLLESEAAPLTAEED
ncbi:MAG: YtxH domain-containing protein [Thermostichales cyanobacterium SZTDM-1c_bins_54]